jgi:hypothetical protein
MLTVATIISDDVFHRPSVENVIAVYDRLENIAAGPLIIGRDVAAETPFTDSPLQPYHGSRVGGEPHTIDTSNRKEDARWPADFASGASCIDDGRSVDELTPPLVDSILTMILSMDPSPDRDRILARFDEMEVCGDPPENIRTVITDLISGKGRNWQAALDNASSVYESGAPVVLGEVNGISITYQKGGEGQ